MKRCTVCTIEKSLEDFYVCLDGRQSRCKACSNRYDPLYWERNRERLNAYHRAYRKRKKAEDPIFLEKTRARARRAAKTRREKMKAMIAEAKNGPCADCGVTLPPEIMDLDHIRGVKKFNIAGSYAGSEGYVSYAALEEELAKCDVRCPTCHRLRHLDEGYLDDEGVRRTRRSGDPAA